MILLTSTSDQLQFTTTGIQSTDWNCSWNDINFAASTMVPGSTEGNQVAIGTVVLITPPTSGDQRQLKFLSIVNRDPTNTQNITVQKVGAAGTFNLTGSYPLQPGWSLQYVDSHGFMLLNAAGAIQYVGAAGATGATGSQGPVGQYLILDADQGEEGMPIPGNQGPIGPTGLQGSAGAQGPQGVATFLDAEVIDPDLFVVPGSPGAPGNTGALGPQGVATFLEGEIGPDGDIGPPGVQGPQGTTGASGPTGPAVYLDADPGDEGQPGAPGLTGPQGVTGAQGPAGYGPPGSDGDQGDDGFAVPGPVGPTGSTGPTGPQGVATYLDAEVFEPDVFVVPGSPGAQGITGPQGPLGYGPPGADGDQGDDGFAVPGNPGVNGVNGAQGLPGPGELLWLENIADDQMLMPPADRAIIQAYSALSQEIVLSSGSAITVTAAQLQIADATLLVMNSNSGVAKVVTLPASTGSLARLLVVDGFGDAGTNNITFAGATVFGVNLIYTNKGMLWLTDTKTLGWVAGL